MLRKWMRTPFFNAEGVGGGGGGSEKSGTEDESGAGAGAGQVELPKTPEELAAYVKAENDKFAVTLKESLTKELTDKFEADKAEAARLAGLTDADKEKETLKKRQDDLDTKEKELTQKELGIKTEGMLTEKGLPKEFRSFVMGTDEKTTQENIEALGKVFQSSLEAAVNEKLKGRTPFKSGSNVQKELDEMSMEEYAQHYNERNKR